MPLVYSVVLLNFQVVVSFKVQYWVSNPSPRNSDRVITPTLYSRKTMTLSKALQASFACVATIGPQRYARKCICVRGGYRSGTWSGGQEKTRRRI